MGTRLVCGRSEAHVCKGAALVAEHGDDTVANAETTKHIHTNHTCILERMPVMEVPLDRADLVEVERRWMLPAQVCRLVARLSRDLDRLCR